MSRTSHREILSSLDSFQLSICYLLAYSGIQTRFLFFNCRFRSWFRTLIHNIVRGRSTCSTPNLTQTYTSTPTATEGACKLLKSAHGTMLFQKHDLEQGSLQLGEHGGLPNHFEIPPNQKVTKFICFLYIIIGLMWLAPKVFLSYTHVGG